MSENLYDIIEGAKEALREFVLDNPDAKRDGLSDAIFEIADGAVPVYTYDLLAVAQDDLGLACEEPEIGTDGTVVGILSANIYTRVQQELNEYLDELEEELTQ